MLPFARVSFWVPIFDPRPHDPKPRCCHLIGGASASESPRIQERVTRGHHKIWLDKPICMQEAAPEETSSSTHAASEGRLPISVTVLHEDCALMHCCDLSLHFLRFVDPGTSFFLWPVGIGDTEKPLETNSKVNQPPILRRNLCRLAPWRSGHSGAFA